jgi:hypothetical protein
VELYLTPRDLGWTSDHLGHILPDPIRGPPGGLFGAGLVLKDTDGDNHTITGINPVVGNKSR